MRIIGIDPGIVATGYGIIEEQEGRLSWVSSGEIKTTTKFSLPNRLRIIYDSLYKLIKQTRPNIMVLESIFLAKNFQTTLKLGQARGMALLAAGREELPVEEYTPSQVKAAVVGYGGAAKEQVQQMVRMILNMKEGPSSHHAADALSVAVCHAHSAKMRSMTRELAQRGR